MVTYLIRRTFQMTIVVFLSSLAIYVLLNVAPGGPLSGLNLAADRRSRVSDAQIAKLESYLGLDKPLALRYLVWLIGDDWLGADKMYVGLSLYEQPRISKNGEVVVQFNRDTGEETIVYDQYRFYAEPGIATIKPTHKLWVWGTEVSPGVFDVTKIQVNAPAGTPVPEDIQLQGIAVRISSPIVQMEDANGNKFDLNISPDTQVVYPEGDVFQLPNEGTWVDVSWLFGTHGVLGKLAGFHANNRGMLRLDFGTSWRLSAGQPVLGIISSRLGNTILLMSSASLLSLIVAIPIGIYSAVNQYSRVDYAVTTFSFFGSAMPVFWFGLMMILLFSVQFSEWGLPFLPSGGTISVRAPQPGSLLQLLGAAPGSFVDRIVHILMPTFVLSLLYMAGWSRFMRASMLEVLRQDYVRTARAKGLLERIVIIKHATRNALIPIVTIIVFEIPNIFGGAILTETIFSYPGMGRLYFDALGQSDWPIVMVILFISAVLVVVATLVRDVLYTVVDPRIKFS